MAKVILKVQVPLLTNSKEKPMALVYSENKKFHGMFPVNDDLMKFMDGRYKIYVRAEIVNNQMQILSEAPWQKW